MRRSIAILAVAAVLPLGTVAAVAHAAEAPSVERPGDVGILVVGAATSSGAGIVRTYYDRDLNNTYETRGATFSPYGGSSVGGGVRVATGDFDGDGNLEIVTAAGTNLPVKVFGLASDATPASELLSIGGFKKGAYVAAGDVNGDGADELIIGSGIGSKTPKLVIRTAVNGSGVPKTVVDSFSPYPSAFRGGVAVASSDVDNTLGNEVITSQASGGGLVKVWHDADLDKKVSDNAVQDSFRPYGASFKGGVSIASGQLESAGSGGAEIFVAPATGKKRVIIRSDADSDGRVSDDPAFDSLFPYGPAYKGGIRLAAGDSDGSGFFVELQTVPATGAGSRALKIFDDTADVGSRISDNPPTNSFVSMPRSVKRGAFVAFAKVRAGVYSYTGLPITIADVTTTTSTIVVPKNAGMIRDLDVEIDVFHSFDGDLDVTLTHVPSGTSLALWNDVGGTNEGFLVRLNDEAGTDISTASNPKADGAITGTYNPGGAALLSTFDGRDASGTWVLSIVDDSGGDTGTLFDWALDVTY